MNPHSCEISVTTRMKRIHVALPWHRLTGSGRRGVTRRPLAAQRDYLTASASSISFLPSGTSLANSA